MLCRCAQAGPSAPVATLVSTRLAWARPAINRARWATSVGSGGGGGGGEPATLAQPQHSTDKTSASKSSTPAGPATVLVTYRGQALHVERGSTLRTALLTAGATPHNSNARLINCRGLGTCGTCAVEVRGAVDPGEWTAAERLRLNFPPHGAPGNARLRLACQVSGWVVGGGVKKGPASSMLQVARHRVLRCGLMLACSLAYALFTASLQPVGTHHPSLSPACR